MTVYRAGADLGLFSRNKAGDKGHQLVLIQAAEGAIEHHLGGQQLVCGVDLTGCPALEGDQALPINHAQLAQHL